MKALSKEWAESKLPNEDGQEIGAGCPASDLFALAGVHKIIGDPHGKLMQDEVADRIGELVKVLQQTVGLADALEIIAEQSKSAKGAEIFRSCAGHIMEAVSEAMPEWDDVLKAVHEANAGVLAQPTKNFTNEIYV